MKITLSLLLMMLVLIPSCACAKAARPVSGAVIVYGLETLSEEALQRIIEADSIGYVCVQQIFLKSWDPAVARARAQKLAKSGKRIVLQIWWGPGGDFTWSKYSFPNIALDESVRADFFREVVGPCIAAFGVENLYGVHLLEETGMQFGTDVGPRENPDDFWTFKEPSNSYSTPWYSGYGDPKVGGVNIANVRRHEKDFTRMTGLKFAGADKWGVLERHLFDRWVSTRLQSGAQVEFAKHIHSRYPKLKAFTWDLINSEGENPRTDHWLEARYFDGVITDPYNSINYNFYYQRAYRTLYPKGEIINFAMGGMAGSSAYPYVSPDIKRARMVGAYMAGADVLGFFELPQDFNNAESWKVNTEIFGRMKSLPKFTKRSDVLLISDGTSNVYSCSLAWTGLKYYDFLPAWEAHKADLSRYRVVVLHSNGGDSLVYWNSSALEAKYGLPGYLDCRKLDNFVARGGVLILSGQTRMDKDCPLFIVREGYLSASGAPNVDRKPLVVGPEGWLREKLGLKRQYKCSVSSVQFVHDPKRVTQTDAGFFFRHGKGAVFFFPFLRIYDPTEPYTSAEWQDYRQLLSDATRGVLGYLGKSDIAREYIDDPEVGNHYMQAASDDGAVEACVLLDNLGELMPKNGWKMAGKDVLTGAENPVLSRDTTAVVVTGRPADIK